MYIYCTLKNLKHAGGSAEKEKNALWPRVFNEAKGALQWQFSKLFTVVNHTCPADDDEVLATLLTMEQEYEISVSTSLQIISSIAGLLLGSSCLQFIPISAHTFTCSSSTWLSVV